MAAEDPRHITTVSIITQRPKEKTCEDFRSATDHCRNSQQTGIIK